MVDKRYDALEAPRDGYAGSGCRSALSASWCSLDPRFRSPAPRSVLRSDDERMWNVANTMTSP
jgi:hypothetical protein